MGVEFDRSVNMFFDELKNANMFFDEIINATNPVAIKHVYNNPSNQIRMEFRLGCFMV